MSHVFYPRIARSICIGLILSSFAVQAEDKPVQVPLDLFTVQDDLEVTVWATSPMFHNPTNIDFDKDGRLWVAEGSKYRGKDNSPDGDRIVVLEDTDGDGKADKTDVFVQEKMFQSPLGVAVLDNKIVVSQPPDMIVYTDVNGDRKFDPAVDKRDVLLTGFFGVNHDHSLHSVTAGPDGLWYWNQGNTGGVFTDKSGKTFRIASGYENPEIAGKTSDDGHVWVGGFAARMNPDGTNATIIGHNFRNSYEQAVTSFGEVFQSDNDDPPACRVGPILEYGNAGFASRDGKRTWQADKRPGQETPVAHWRQEDPGTMPSGDVYGGGAPTGVAFYENGALGDKWNGLLLACEAARNVVFGYQPKADGAGFKLERTDFFTSNKEKKFAGTDTAAIGNEIHSFFRPSDVTVGPDGAIYVADWFDPRVGGHAAHDDTRSGTIYRIAPKGFKSKVPKIDLAKTEGQIESLKSPAPNVRNSGFTRLKAQGAKAVPAVSAILKDKNPYIAARGIWLLAQLGPEGVAKVKPLLESKDENVRLVAYRALRRANQDVLKIAAKMAKDPSAAVRRDVALTMRDFNAAESKDILVEIARQFDGKDRAYLEAFGTGAKGKEGVIYTAIAADPVAANPEEWNEAYDWMSWRLSAPESIGALKTRALSAKLSDSQRKHAVDALAFIHSKDAAAALMDVAATKDNSAAGHARWWLTSLRWNEWKDFDLTPELIKRGIVEAPAPLVSVPYNEPPNEPTKLPPLDEVLKLKGDATAGKTTVAACYACHKIGKQGVEFGPDLTQFGKIQPREVIAKAILTPSADISHGFNGFRVETHDGVSITGLIIDKGDPIVVKSIGGMIQKVPRDRMKIDHELWGRSLMFTPDQMGLTGQGVADIVAFLQSDLIEK